MGNESNRQSIGYNEPSHNAVTIAKKNSDKIKSSIIEESELQAYKQTHTKVEGWIQSIPPKYRLTKSAKNVLTVKKSNLGYVAPMVAKELCDDVGFLPYNMCLDFAKQVESVFNQLKYAEFKAKLWFEINLSGDWGGKSHIAAAILVGCDVGNDKVAIAIALIAEEWKEEDNVRIIVPKWNRVDLQKYANYILYKQVSKAIEN